MSQLSRVYVYCTYREQVQRQPMKTDFDTLQISCDDATLKAGWLDRDSSSAEARAPRADARGSS